ncbi:MAG: zf-HC2 domain-containing protein [Massiliimalia sp.]|jgi:hypothetical protein
MEKISCNVIGDLLPLYAENAVSEDSRRLIEEHLSQCEECRHQLKTMTNHMVLPVSTKACIQDMEILKKIRKHLRSRKLIAMILSAVITLSLVFGAYSLMVIPRQCIPFRSDLISVIEADGELYAAYSGETFAGTVSHHPIEVEIDGETVHTVAFYMTENFWSKYIEPIFSDNPSSQYTFSLGKASEIDQVYYGEYDKESDLPIIDQNLLETLDLIWEKE